MTGGKTLIMGAGGRVGRLLRGVWRHRRDIVWQSRSGADFAWSLDEGPAALARCMAGVSAVVCLAGATPADAADMALNVALAKAAIAAAQDGGARTVLLASSVAVYGPGAGPFREDDPCRPDSAYGRAKLAMEREGSRIADGLAVTSLRIGNLVGADSLFRALSAEGRVTLDRFPDGATPARSYIDPEALALVLDRLTARRAAGGDLPGVLNVASQPPVDMAALVRAAGAEPAFRPAGAGARRLVSLNLTRLLSLVPDIAGPKGAEDMVAAWRRAGGTA